MSKIKEIKARQIFDSRGNPTVEADVITSNGIKGTAAVPSGASTGKYEAVELRDNNKEKYLGKSVFNAVSNINKLISKIKNKLKNQFINSENILITRERHRQNLINCAYHLQEFQEKKFTKDFDKAAEDLRLATRHLGMIVGKVDVEELLDSIFNDFCIGK